MSTCRFSSQEQALQSQLAIIQADITRTQAAIDALNGQADPSSVAERSRLSTLLVQSNNSYAALLKSLQDVRLAEAQSSNNVAVVEGAVADTRPVRPRTVYDVLLGTLAGLLLGIGFALLKEYLDDSVKSVEQAEQILDAPALGIIPRPPKQDTEDAGLLDHLDGRSPIAEAYRVLRTGIALSEVDDPVRTLVVISGRPSEGKSTVVANLSTALAMSGKRVIALDMDLRRPVLGQLFGFQDRTRGVVTALIQHARATELLQPTGLENLLVMTSGPIPPNPAELVGSRRMSELIEELRLLADVVLFDSPPMLAVADAALLARACDAALIVVRAGQTRAGDLRKTRNQLQQTGTRLLGFVLVGVAVSRNAYYYTYSGDQPESRRAWWRRRKPRASSPSTASARPPLRAGALEGRMSRNGAPSKSADGVTKVSSVTSIDETVSG